MSDAIRPAFRRSFDISSRLDRPFGSIVPTWDQRRSVIRKIICRDIPRSLIDGTSAPVSQVGSTRVAAASKTAFGKPDRASAISFRAQAHQTEDESKQVDRIARRIISAILRNISTERSVK